MLEGNPPLFHHTLVFWNSLLPHLCTHYAKKASAIALMALVSLAPNQVSDVICDLFCPTCPTCVAVWQLSM
jgi:hypothetical protein